MVCISNTVKIALVGAATATSAYNFHLRISVDKYGSDLPEPIESWGVEKERINGCKSNMVIIPGFGSAFTIDGESKRGTVGVQDVGAPANSSSYEDLFLMPQDEGTATVPGSDPVTSSCDTGSLALFIGEDGTFHYEDGTGVWMACPNSVLDVPGLAKSDILLHYREAGQRTLAGCAEVTLDTIDV